MTDVSIHTWHMEMKHCFLTKNLGLDLCLCFSLLDQKGRKKNWMEIDRQTSQTIQKPTPSRCTSGSKSKEAGRKDQRGNDRIVSMVSTSREILRIHRISTRRRPRQMLPIFFLTCTLSPVRNVTPVILYHKLQYLYLAPGIQKLSFSLHYTLIYLVRKNISIPFFSQ